MATGTGTALLGLLLGLAVQGQGHAGSAGPKEQAQAQQQEERRAERKAREKAEPKPTARSISHGVEGDFRNVALTLDDGPHPVWTPKVLDLLDSYGIKATFCLIGPNAEANPGLVRRIVDEGHRLCNHSVHHDTAMDQGEDGKAQAYRESEIRDARRMIDKASGGAPVPYYRAPGGAFTPDSRHYAAAHGMRPLGWTADSNDWRLPGTATIVRTVQQQVTTGAQVVLLHDGGGDRAQSYDALRQLIPWFKGEGYGFTFPEG
ncbi:polysaccharide deacetylase family protein [Streptomyces sp. HNM0574]|uniref:polysaccharide deacetylase family protein n=1 Tax=Streptomyces sp. HNM0574 TaxID=2714954 RepID=UPI00146C06A2|nr:polysaccharide deacetylase family protein [Streptomyces sp. HNM0574]NLU70851.1 polysaccharide deacetylase family protein [Streptomyces sp. HNM0574]